MTDKIEITVPLVEAAELAATLAAIPELGIEIDASQQALERQTIKKGDRVSFSLAMSDWAIVVISLSGSATALLGLAKALIEYHAARLKKASTPESAQPAAPPMQVVVQNMTINLGGVRSPEELRDELSRILSAPRRVEPTESPGSAP